MTDEKVAKIYFCETCNYKCSNKNNFEKHLATAKHKNLQNTDEKVAKVANDCKTFVCICGKSYKHRQSLFTHQTKCTYEPPKSEEIKQKNDPETLVPQNIIIELMKQQQEVNNELMKQQNEVNNELMKNTVVTIMKEIAPNIGNSNNTNSNNTNSNNTNQFNINVFLNEDCKNAINMSDFIKSIEVSLEQLDLTKRQGLEKGITKVIMDNMSKLSIHERPLHCTDTKRDTLYIKDNDKWEKDSDKSKIKEVLNKTQNKNYPALINWKKENPDYMDYDHKQLYYAKAMSQAGKPLENVENKIIKNICKANYVKDDLNTKE